ncbi:2-iminobutanoate/2-iminopropanoate deaminase [Roseivirga ehrenbergii]|uniref:Reactive intermediate/imine deaminase n=1 Tax=Roseivirga ehrenbergii (strain DSM 102268 / JCM 13514 / KCTC 12282 / NCIMB 14502 / KMM 6017) TaxID=279360 RepID=A0A150XTV3_ROSEK|nr:RidA family protein [Roseivirga ehrenbergii]KYG82170.1 reactive intermediate/imine deaminase [Roseivirga ehrenbergii]TCL01996.1 2-iminobutanoate/2-iminopropanoate deaminase [Roseivirga ehrenbergii]
MSKIIVNSPDAPAPIGPYSQAVKAGNTLYVSGQIPFDQATGEMINENITEETHQVMKNLEAILSAAGMTFNNIVKCSIFIKDMNQFATINEAYAVYFKENPPARECVEVARLPKDVNVEISCVAVDL